MEREDAAAVNDPEMHRQILADMRDGVVTLDLAGQVMTFNPAAGRLLATDPATVIGQPFAHHFLLDPAYEPLTELVLQAVYEPGRSHGGEVDLVLVDGRHTLYVRTTLLRGPSAPRGIIVVLSDLTEQRKRRKLKRLFGAYIDPRIVTRLLGRTDELEGGGRVLATIAFLDLQGFTRLAELLSPTELVRLLNIYLEEMSAPISANQGVTDKYIGDAIMAFWSASFVAAGEPAALACHAALAQRARLPALQRRLQQEIGHPALAEGVEIRCGIATGEVLAGSIGPEHARSYTVIGDTVNLAARLETANKTYQTRILVSAATREQAGDRFTFRSRGTIELPGRARPEHAFELIEG